MSVTAHTVETENSATSTPSVTGTFNVTVSGGMTPPGPGNDTIILNINAVRQDGYDGEDTLVVEENDVDFRSLAVELLNMEIIDLTDNGQQTVTFDAASLKDMTDGNNELTIRGDTATDSEDTVNLENGWNDSNPQEVIDNVAYNILTKDDATLKIEDGINYHIA